MKKALLAAALLAAALLAGLCAPAIAEDAESGASAGSSAGTGDTVVIGDAHGVPVEAKVEMHGTIGVVGPWTRSTNPGAHVGGVYVILENRGDAPIRLVSATTPVARKTALRDLPMVDGVIRGVELPDGIEIPAGGRVDLRPGGLHILLAGLVQPLRPGRSFPMTLTFADGTAIDIEVGVSDVASMRIVTP